MGFFIVVIVSLVGGTGGGVSISTQSEVGHTVLDVVGLVPGAGELADGLNALVYLAEGNTADAALSAAAMIPIAGWVATGAKGLRKVSKVIKNAKAIKKLKASRLVRSTPLAQASGKLVAGSPAHKAQRWIDYQQRNGTYSYDRWSKQYQTNMRNASYGLGREAAYRKTMGGASRISKTPFTNRQIDIYKHGEKYMGQLKTGKLSLTKQTKIDLKKDKWLIKTQGYKIEYILEKGASKPALEAMKRAGVSVHIGPKF